MYKIFIVDDDEQSQESTAKILKFEGFNVVSFSRAEEALRVLQGLGSQELPDLILSDVRMPGITGLEFLKVLRVKFSDVPVVLMTAFGKVDDAVWAMKKGAVDFLSKPFKRQKLMESVGIALQKRKSVSVSGDWIGSSRSLQELRVQTEQVALTQAAVLITGESGTGKELVARMIHERGARKNRPFVAVNCAAFQDTLLENELFGHEKGAFTGADSAHAGLFEAADTGTLFLDEIAEMSLSAQAKLLRVIQEREFRRLGSNESRKLDVRIVAATHRDLRAKTLDGTFRQDLLYRLEVIHLHVPTLRERAEDLAELSNYFLKVFSERHQKPVMGLSAAALKTLCVYQWPGNIRELMNVLERAVVFCRGTQVELDHLPEHLMGPQAQQIAQNLDRIEIKIGTSLKDVEDLLIRKTLEATEGDKTATAKLLGINSRTIYRKLGEQKPN